MTLYPARVTPCLMREISWPAKVHCELVYYLEALYAECREEEDAVATGVNTAINRALRTNSLRRVHNFCAGGAGPYRACLRKHMNDDIIQLLCDFLTVPQPS